MSAEREILLLLFQFPFYFFSPPEHFMHTRCPSAHFYREKAAPIRASDKDQIHPAQPHHCLNECNVGNVFDPVCRIPSLSGCFMHTTTDHATELWKV